MERKLYQRLATAVAARHNCIAAKNTEWLDRWEAEVRALVDAHMPSGGGFDNGTTLDLDTSTGEKLVLHTAFHHMNDGGYYDGWTEHTITVTPSFLGGFDLRVSGRNRNDIKDYIAECFQYTLSRDVPESAAPSNASA